MKKIFVLSLVLLLSLGCLNAQNPRENKAIFEKAKTEQEKQYLQFLYEYMPLNDLADYDGDFFLNQVRYAIKARETFDWGKKIPEDIFKHFVLVYRVNNENLDTARMYIFETLKDRIKRMSMYDAALEVNHWCHEKVNYKASDGRTSSPLATIRTSWGRCGEESTFTVTALRAMGLPARQCYTPRWAHTDDNHAWVEVWIDGVWHYLGACEPEPELDIAWFDAPVKRAMMVHTTVFGKYNGKEQKNFESDLYSKINLLSNYTDTKRLEIKVIDSKGNAVENAQVSFGLYNYAEYYPIAKIYTDKNGVATLETGYGDLMIWAKKDGKTASALAKAEVKNMTLTINPTKKTWQTQKFKLCPPTPKPIKVVSEEKKAANAIRLAYEDSLRESYLKTFPRNQETNLRNQVSEKRIKELNFSKEDAIKIGKYIDESWGNYEEIEKVLASQDENAVAILGLLYEKDLRDIRAEVVLSHLKAYKNYPAKEEALKEFVLNPRIQLEKITNYREFLQKHFADQANSFIENPQQIADWINQNIKLNTVENYYDVQISPEGILRIGQCDKLSREILFVAIARSFGIAARYEWAEGRAQYKLSAKEDWKYPQFEIATDEPLGRLTVTNSAKNKIKPEYYIHFTLQRLVNDEFMTLDFEYDPKFAKFPETLEIPAGYYRLMSGNRDAAGNIYVIEQYFFVTAGAETKIEIEMEEIDGKLSTLGTLDMDKKIQLIDGKKQSLKELSQGKGLVLAIVDPYSEPVRHLMADMPLVKSEMEKWGGGIVFVMTKLPNQSIEKLYPNLPNQSLFAHDADKKMQKAIVKATNFDFANNYPLLCFITKEGEIVFLSEGYRIGSGDSLLKVIHQLESRTK
ncbi:MAG: transglutaminase domain-containing protein [Bacteroidales bacterium]|nr:transglutaminase domain-containing protein [Bacteroidales bacterium]